MRHDEKQFEGHSTAHCGLIVCVIAKEAHVLWQVVCHPAGSGIVAFHHERRGSQANEGGNRTVHGRTAQARHTPAIRPGQRVQRPQPEIVALRGDYGLAAGDERNLACQFVGATHVTA